MMFVMILCIWERGGALGALGSLAMSRYPGSRGRQADGPKGRRALLAGYMIVGVGLNITDGGSAFPSPPPFPSSLPFT